MIKQELKIIASSILYFTRLPFPVKIEYKKEYQLKILTWLPLIGIICGGIGALIYWLAAFIFQSAVSIMLSMAAMILSSGAFHEDGFADVCDGFGGGWTKERKLEIMKDSCIGAYGAIGLCVLFLTKFAVLSSLDPTVIVATIIMSQTISRWATLLISQKWSYARTDNTSKSRDSVQHLPIQRILLASIVALLPFFLFTSPWIWCLVPIQLLVSILAGMFFKRHIGGYTGDCLGAAQQVLEVAGCLYILAIT